MRRRGESARLRLLALVTCLAALCGCDGGRELTVASKLNSENQILAEMLALVAKQEGIAVRKHVPYGNTFDCQEAIKAGTIDIYPEYTGTGLSMMGVPPVADADQALQRVHQLFEPFGLRWLGRLGVDNAYVLVVRAEFASRHELRRISQLAELEEGIRFATGEEFVNRVVDGMPALIRRYGLSNTRIVLETDDKQKLYDALLRKDVDVAVGFATDGRIEEYSLTILEDDNGLFSPYEAVPLVRSEALQRFAGLERAYERLAQVLDNAQMRTLNKQVELNGADPEAVAGAFLVDAEIIEPEASKQALKKLLVAIPPSTSKLRFSRLNGQALAALRQANAGRRLEFKEFADPVGAVVRGETFVAVVGAEFFFELDPVGRLPRLVPRIEAVSPVGFRMLHVVAKPGRLDPAEPVFDQVGRIGVGPEHGSTHRLATILVDAYAPKQVPEIVFGETNEQLDQAEQGELDAVLSLIKPGSPLITLAVQGGELSLYPLPSWDAEEREFRYPFIRSAKVPAKTYPGIDEALDTVSTQVVIAAPGKLRQHIGNHGPGDALDAARKPLPLAMKEKISKALAGPRMIDPTLPGESVGVGRKPSEIAPLNPAPEISLLTAVVLLLLIYVFVEVFRARKPT